MNTEDSLARFDDIDYEQERIGLLLHRKQVANDTGVAIEYRDYM